MKRFLIYAALIGTVSLAAIVPAKTKSSHGSCAGTLIRDQGDYIIKSGTERICMFDKTGEAAVSAICSTGRHCKVTGLIDFCKEIGECDYVSHITSVKANGHGKPARLTGAGCETEKDCPWN